VKVTFAYPHTTADGKTYKVDDTADLDDDVARQLVKDGHARLDDGGSKTTRAQSKTTTTTTSGGRSDAKGSDS
jgi:hypothetical protein